MAAQRIIQITVTFTLLTTVLWFGARPAASAVSIQYTYDDAGRLTQADYGDAAITYTYDDNGNLLSRVVAAAGQTTTTTSTSTTTTTTTSTTDAPATTAGGGAASPAGDTPTTTSVTTTTGADVTTTTVPDGTAADSNGDGITDVQAVNLGLDPIAPDGDSDGDGIPDADEVGDPDNPIDSDGDGLIDAMEPGDTAHDPLALAFRLSTGAADGLGLPELADQPVSLTATGGISMTSLNNGDTGCPVFCETNLLLEDSSFDYPLGLYSFRIMVDTGGTATVVIQLPEDAVIPEDAVYRKADDFGNYTTFDNAVIDRTANTVTLTLTDGGPGDADGTPNGVIYDPGGIGVPEGAAIPAGTGTVPVDPGGDSGSGCFIATAAYGSPMETHVHLLRNFRDRFLLTNPVGSALVRIYVTHSPPLAAFIAQHGALKWIVRLGLAPLILFAWLSLSWGLWAAWGGVIASALLPLTSGAILMKHRKG